jgi:hypothetical protein
MTYQIHTVEQPRDVDHEAGIEQAIRRAMRVSNGMRSPGASSGAYSSSSGMPSALQPNLAATPDLNEAALRSSTVRAHQGQQPKSGISRSAASLRGTGMQILLLIDGCKS